MADKNNSLESIEIRFASGAFQDDDTTQLLGVHGREEISRLYTFDFVFSRQKAYTSDEIDQLLKAPCALTLGPKTGDVVHGLMSHIEAVDHERHNVPRYVARLVPNLWLLTLTKASRVFLGMTVPKIVTTLLQDFYQLGEANFHITNRNTKKSPEHDYVAQYQESDWDFIQRRLEHEGFFYWFEHGDADKLIISDDNTTASDIEDDAISYRERNNLSSGRQATIWDWNVTQQRIPARVTLLDYNYNTPNTRLLAPAVIDASRGFGTQVDWGYDFKDNDVGAELAKIWAEQARCQRYIVKATTDCSRFRVGHSFELENHYDSAYDGEYLITKIDHRVGYELLPDGERINDLPQRYFARFEAIPMDVPFRPERRTPWPRISGVTHGTIDGDTNGDYAQLDSEGRYIVSMPFDCRLNKNGKASHPIRMAQPYAGAAYGHHNPLHKGTEVLIAHENGDPDRPVIVGSVPNPRTKSPSTSVNATQSVTQTASGIRLELEDLQNS